MALSMDSLTLKPAETPPSDIGSSCGSPMPGFAPLAMPAQSFRRFSRSDRRSWIDPRLVTPPILTRLVVFGGAIALSAYGAYQMYKVVGAGTITALDWVMVVLFVITFSWLCLSFTATVVGFVWLLTHPRRHRPLPASLSQKPAVVMPIYNDAPPPCCGPIQAIPG